MAKPSMKSRVGGPKGNLMNHPSIHGVYGKKNTVNQPGRAIRGDLRNLVTNTPVSDSMPPTESPAEEAAEMMTAKKGRRTR